jgi:hypothetical protein
MRVCLYEVGEVVVPTVVLRVVTVVAGDDLKDLRL